jgi:hypothetical protein
MAGGDVAAGVSGCLIMIPSVIAYARLTGLPPESGLYAALVPLLIYPFVTSSPQVIVGPDIAICLLMASAIAPLAGGDPNTRRPGGHVVAGQRRALAAGQPLQIGQGGGLSLETGAGRLHDGRGVDSGRFAIERPAGPEAGQERLFSAPN